MNHELFEGEEEFCGGGVTTDKVESTVVGMHNLSGEAQADARTTILGREEGDEYLLLTGGADGGAIGRDGV